MRDSFLPYKHNDGQYLRSGKYTPRIRNRVLSYRSRSTGKLCNCAKSSWRPCSVRIKGCFAAQSRAPSLPSFTNTTPLFHHHPNKSPPTDPYSLDMVNALFAPLDTLDDLEFDVDISGASSAMAKSQEAGDIDVGSLLPDYEPTIYTVTFTPKLQSVHKVELVAKQKEVEYFRSWATAIRFCNRP